MVEIEDKTVAREVVMHSPGGIEGVPMPGGFPGNCSVLLNAANEVVSIVYRPAPNMNAAAADEQLAPVEVEAQTEQAARLPDETAQAGASAPVDGNSMKLGG